MLSTLNKKRSSKEHLIIHMKFFLLVVIGVLLYNSNDARQFTSDALKNASEIIAPESTSKLTITF